jgi:uncharacterized phosphosugar-binding protein
MSDLAYIDALMPILQRAVESQTALLLTVADRMAAAIAHGRRVFAFGAGHAGILAEELFYRAGGLVPILPIFGPGLTLTTRPITLETALERLPGYAALLLDAQQVEPGDLLIIHSNSGRNTVAIEMGEDARARGLTVVALVNVAQCHSLPSRHPRGLRLTDPTVADLVIDNCGVVGDAAVNVPGVPAPVGATSTVVGAALLNAVVVECVRLLAERGVEPPVTRSANLDGSDEHNRRVWEQYRGRLNYL